MKRCVPSQRNVPMKKYTDKKSETKISVKEKRQGQKKCVEKRCMDAKICERKPAIRKYA